MKALSGYLRVVDANLNRAREGLLVIEDTARFVLCDDVSYKKLRALRHKLDAITRVAYPKLLKERDSVDDGGRVMPEGRRGASCVSPVSG